MTVSMKMKLPPSPPIELINMVVTYHPKSGGRLRRMFTRQRVTVEIRPLCLRGQRRVIEL